MIGLINFIIFLSENSSFCFSYYVLDGSKKRVTFDDGDEGVNDEILPPIETEETEENEDQEEEVEETVSVSNQISFPKTKFDCIF